MFVLKAEKRELNSKGKQLRREGKIPAVLYGKHLEESVLVQMPQREVDQFLKTNAVGTKFELDISGKKHMAIVKEISREPHTFKIKHLGFIALKAGEKVKSVSRVVLIGKERIEGVVLQTLDEIAYRALPAHLVDVTEVNVEKLLIGENITVAELDFAKNPDIEILIPLDTVIVTVSDRKGCIDETPADGEEGDDGSETDNKGV